MWAPPAAMRPSPPPSARAAPARRETAIAAARVESVARHRAAPRRADGCRAPEGGAGAAGFGLADLGDAAAARSLPPGRVLPMGSAATDRPPVVLSMNERRGLFILAPRRADGCRAPEGGAGAAGFGLADLGDAAAAPLKSGARQPSARRGAARCRATASATSADRGRDGGRSCSAAAAPLKRRAPVSGRALRPQGNSGKSDGSQRMQAPRSCPVPRNCECDERGSW
jgi:hypothetical protein